MNNALQPDEIRNQSFRIARKGGLEATDVARFLGVVATETENLQHEVAELRAQLESTRTALAESQASASAIPGPQQVGERVTAVLASAEQAAANRRAEAARDAEEMRPEAERYADRVRAEIDALHRKAEVETDAYRRDTIAHATRLRSETESAMDQIRTEAELAMRRTQDQVTAELKARADAVRESERSMFERLLVTAEEVERALDRRGQPPITLRILQPAHPPPGTVEPHRPGPATRPARVRIRLSLIPGARREHQDASDSPRRSQVGAPSLRS
jgi:cell division septum initiation protein DivIVA